MAPALASGDGGGNDGGEEAAARRLRLRAAAHARARSNLRRLQHEDTREHGIDTCQENKTNERRQAQGKAWQTRAGVRRRRRGRALAF